MARQHPSAPSDALIVSERLSLRPLDERDAAFLVELLNDPRFIESIGDREVRTQEDALAFLEYSVRDSYRTHGFGPYLVEWRHDGTAAGLCGLYRREYLTCADVGYALLPSHRGQGVAREAVTATLRWAREALGLDEVVGITAPGNRASARVLEHCGLRLAGTLRTRVAELTSELYVPRASSRASAQFVDADLAALD